jgi:hypothetical protein
VSPVAEGERCARARRARGRRPPVGRSERCLRSLAFAGCVALLAACEPGAERVTADNYVGETTCIGCHQEQTRFLATAHFHTSAHPSPATVHGSFDPERNILRTVNPHLHYRMEARADGMYQTAVLAPAMGGRTVTERIDLVTGSGRKGQSYLFWRDDRLFQLPVSYWTEVDDWVLSPGFREVVPRFDRPANPRCLECHTTYFEALPGAQNRYDPERYVLGITCEACHGGGREHVDRQNSWIRRLAGQAIANPATFSRERRIDQCALCHGGIGESLRPAFSYRPGARLPEYVRQREFAADESVDVHGNQVGLLRRSPCFQGSETMTCSTCHDVHQPQRDLVAHSNTCLTCHQPTSCGLTPIHGQDALSGKCVGCHMPELPTASIVSVDGGQILQPVVRTHWIRVYPQLGAASNVLPASSD